MGKEIRKVAVIGSGILGTQIAVQSAHFGYDVSVYDSDQESFGLPISGTTYLYTILIRNLLAGLIKILNRF